jgi:hypothetical protein
VVTKINASTDFRVLQIQDLKFYGTEEDLDVVARVGEGLDGKVANFRVYDKYLHEEQALELWDAQKDQFGRAESSVVVHKGRLGVGTTEPEGRFAVLDEAHAPEEFPPRAMTDYETYMEGHGVFRASASEEYAKTIAGGASGDEAWTMFDKQNTNWTGGDSYTGTSNTYAGTHTSGGYGGDYIELKLPYKIKLEEFIIQPSPNNLYRWSKSGVIVAKNTNDDAWTNIFSWSGSSVASSDKYNSVYFRDVDTSNAFDTFRLVITSVDSQPYVTLFQWRLFGTRERGQSTLHDGSLTLTKNLTVPRIGPAFDADDTPRRDRLVVEYNTSTNPTANGTVKDTSGMGLDGLMVNGASYDATEKALVFDGTDDYVSMSDWKYNTGFIHSFSGWIKFKSPEESWNVVYGVGDASGSSRTNFTIWSRTNDSYFRTEADGSGSYIDHTFEYTGNMDKWLHMAVVKSSARIDSTRIYINGVLLPQTNATLADRDIALPNTPQNFNLNGYGPTGGYTGNVNLSNVKFYDTALTADEVKRLYDMGRLGNVIAQPVHIAAPLYAPGTIVQVEQAVKTDTSSTTSASYVDISGLSVTIRPKFSTSKLLVTYALNLGGGGHCFVKIERTQGGSTTYIGVGDVTGDLVPVTTYWYSDSSTNWKKQIQFHSFEFLDSANGTEPITYQLIMRTKDSVYALYVNRAENEDSASYYGRTSSSITVKEVCQ